MAVNKGPKQAPTYSGPTTTPATAASRNKGVAPSRSPVPQMRPANFDSVVAQQLQAASDNGDPTPRVLGGPNQNVSNFSQAMGNFGQGVRGIFEAIQPFTPMGIAMSAIQNIGKGINAARNGGGPDPKVRAAQQRQLLAQQAAMGGGDDPTFMAEPEPIAPPVPEVPAPAPTPPQNTMPQQRPPWWPAYLPWPPAPTSPMQMTPTPYSTSYSGLQNAISGAQNPLMMGIGGMIRRP